MFTLTVQLSSTAIERLDALVARANRDHPVPGRYDRADVAGWLLEDAVAAEYTRVFREGR